MSIVQNAGKEGKSRWILSTVFRHRSRGGELKRCCGGGILAEAE